MIPHGLYIRKIFFAMIGFPRLRFLFFLPCPTPSPLPLRPFLLPLPSSCHCFSACSCFLWFPELLPLSPPATCVFNHSVVLILLIQNRTSPLHAACNLEICAVYAWIACSRHLGHRFAKRLQEGLAWSVPFVFARFYPKRAQAAFDSPSDAERARATNSCASPAERAPAASLRAPPQPKRAPVANASTPAKPKWTRAADFERGG